MITFRKKIFIIYVVFFLLFIAFMFPFATHAVRKIANKAMEDRANELIIKIQASPNNDSLIRRLKEQKPTLFFRVSVIDDEKKILYDSHTKRLLGPRFSQEYVVDHPEVLEAFEDGVGYNEDYSELLEQKFSYLAKAFDFHGKTYVIRTAFPNKYVTELTRDCEMGFLGLGAAILLLFSLITWFVIHQLTRPIQQIINAIIPYQRGIVGTIPEIKLKSTNTSDEFDKLAMTLNSLSTKIQKHIDNLTAERNEKEAILEALVEGVIAVNGEMLITYANSSALKLWTAERDNLVGKSFTILHQPECYALLAMCQKEKRTLSESVTLVNGGKKIYLDIVAAPKGGSDGAILVVHDKSSHYKLLEMRKDFVANASHELKTPITIIRGFAETLHDNPELPKETTALITQKIVDSCQRMTSLIKDLLTLSDVENLPSSRLVLCNLIEIVNRCCLTLQDANPEAKLKVQNQHHADIFIIADPSLMELAVLNLLENAIKYSPAPAKVSIILEKTLSEVIIKISDQGMGIPEADLEHIFERFYTVNKAHSQKLGGSGLGLSIVQTIINKHFGQIFVNSYVGKGTTFTIILSLDLDFS